MRLLKVICRELGVEVGEKWKNDVGDTYKLTKDGLFYEYSPGVWEEVNRLDYMRFLTGKLKPTWKPKKGYRYYIPHIHKNDMERYRWNDWLETEEDIWYLDNNLAFKTKEEAIETANKMLATLREDEYV